MGQRILGLDIGIASVGWAVVDYDKEDRKKNKIVKSGVRTFTKAETPDKGESLALKRRKARSARRTLERKRQRMKKIKYLFIEYLGLSNQDLFTYSKKEDNTIYMQHNIEKSNRIDVWELRHKAINEKLNTIELARVLTHIAKRRGYFSNSKVQEDKQEDKGKVKDGIKKLETLVSTSSMTTIGSAIYEATEQGEAKRNHPIKKIKKDGTVDIDKDTGKPKMTAGYQFVATRALLEKEIKIIFEIQRELGNKSATKEFEKKYLELFNKQLPIQFDEKMIGKCTFEPKEDKAPRFAYSSEEFIVLDSITKTSLNHNQSGETRTLLSFVTIDEIFHELQQGAKTGLKYSVLRKKFKIDDAFRFNAINYVFDPEKKKKLPNYKKIIEMEDWLTDEQKKKIEKRLDAKLNKSARLKTFLDLRYFLNLKKSREFVSVKYNQNPEDVVFVKLQGYHAIKTAFKEYENDFEILFSNRKEFNKVADILARKKDDKLRREEFLKLSSKIEKNVAENLLLLSFSGFIKYSFKALEKIRPILLEGKKNHEALTIIYGHHSLGLKKMEKQKSLRALNDSEKHQITSPVAKRSIAQTRKVINAILRDKKTFGEIDRIHIELAREIKNSKKQRDKISQGQNDYRSEKELAKIELLEHIDNMSDFSVSENDKGFEKLLLKYRLYRQQGGKDVYQWREDDTKGINITRLITDENYCQRDHVLPECRSFDSSLNNLVLTLTYNNQNKDDFTPFEWIANEEEDSSSWKRFETYINSFANIKSAKRKKLLRKNYPKRRGNEISADDIENEESSFIARNLIDTQTTAKFLKNFIEQNLLIGEEDGKQKVFTRNGMLTSTLRYQWGINAKNRENNYHHAEDAIIIAFATQGEVQKLSTLSASNIKYNLKKIPLKKEPMDNFRDEVQKSIEEIFVSTAPRRKVTGAAHKETICSKKLEKNKGTFEVNDGLAENGEVKRVDVFKKENKYHFVFLYPSDFEKYNLPKKTIKGIEIDEGFEFLFSLFKDEFIEIKPNNKEAFRGYLKFVEGDGRFNVQPHWQSKFDKKTGRISTGSLEYIKKYQVDILGNVTNVKREIRISTKKVLRKQKEASLKKKR